MYGDAGLKLVRELKRYADGDLQQPYNNEQVRLVTQEVSQLHADGIRLLEQAAALTGDGDDQQQELQELRTAQLNIVAAVIRRNQRCLIAYVHHRMLRVEDMVWRQRASGAGRQLPAKHLVDKMSAEESRHYLDYAQVLHRYHQQSCVPILTGTSGHQPPQLLLVRVRAVKDLRYETELGVKRIMLVGSEDYMRAREVQQFIESGHLVKC